MTTDTSKASPKLRRLVSRSFNMANSHRLTGSREFGLLRNEQLRLAHGARDCGANCRAGHLSSGQSRFHAALAGGGLDLVPATREL